ncbi:hypothetical protein [Bacillus sp. REN10]|uniref:hypothetical protein n=1 Tax=Bacillus sp. REN10 TaxID=2782541 RepID=UPI001EEEC53D|nr:hypothetical protein [Bacillus sp. REN10]
MMKVILELIGSFLFAGIYVSSDVLDTKKIDHNIERLRQYDWFENIYNDERYHRLFFVNRKVRHYLQSSIRVKRMMKNERAQKKLIVLLNKQL